MFRAATAPFAADEPVVLDSQIPWFLIGHGTSGLIHAYSNVKVRYAILMTTWRKKHPTLTRIKNRGGLLLYLSD